MPLVHHFFEQSVAEKPDHVALICDKQSLTYQELNALANQMAHFLSSQGVKAGDKVSFLLPKTVDLYITLLAILKVGAAYVPLDPEYPAERIEYILQESQAKLLLTSQAFSQQLINLRYQQIFLEAVKTQIQQHPHTPFINQGSISEEDLCYIIFTSGSTGHPKGVEITHRGVCNYITGAKAVYQLSPHDRVYQGFSVAFDASVEEIWMAFASSATLVTGSSAVLHEGASLVQFLNLHKVTVFSTVPTLLSFLEGAIPSLKTLILGGEICPPELVKRWFRPGLRIFNTYGPTETTIVATYQEYRPERPIAIGQPLPNYNIYILDEKFEPVLKGKMGEIYIGGPGLARGYTKEELTQERFIYIPQLQQRLYRTADLAYITEEGDIQYAGRADDQVKLRGFRVELSEIDATLMQFPGIQAAAVTLHELVPSVQTVVAYIVSDNHSKINTEALLTFLHKLLPDYMVPHFIETVDSLPTLASGKVDRKKLPKPTFHHYEVTSDYRAPVTELEKRIVSVWENLFKCAPISINANFFNDLGGHSLLAAKAVSSLRTISGIERLSMLDLYENATIEQLANKISENYYQGYSAAGDATHGIPPAGAVISNVRYYLCSAAQLMGCFLQFAIHAWEFLFIVLILTLAANTYSMASWQFWSIVALFFVGLPPLLFIISIIAKWLIIGRIKPGEYPLWGFYYLRWWLVQRLLRLAPVDYLIGSPWMNLYCRLMGAKIGNQCHIGTADIRTFDLLTIDDHSSINHNVGLMGYTVEKGYLKIGSITIGKRCYVGAKSVLNINTVMEDDSLLEDLSLLPANTTISKGKHYYGSPARELNDSHSPLWKPETIAEVTTGKKIKSGLFHYLALLLITVLHYAAYLPAISIVAYFYEKGELLKAIFVGAPVGALLFIVLLCLFIFLTKKILVGTLKPGIYPLKSAFYVRLWLVERLWDAPEVEVLAESLYFPWFLRRMGANIGKSVELADLPHIQADLLTVNKESFTTGGVFIGVPRIYKGYVKFANVTIGTRTFVGNTALLPPQTELGDGCLLGCLTAPPINGDAKKNNTAWLGSPAFFLPRREVVEGFSEETTFHPPRSLFFARLIIEFIRIITPTTFYFLCLIGIFLSLDYLLDNFSLKATILLLPFFDIFIVVAVSILSILLKWILMGQYKETIKPLWSFFIWKSDLLERLYNVFLSHSLFEPLLGTPFIAPFLRMLGTKVGRRVFIDTRSGFAEYDLTEIGDDAALNWQCVIQTHLFEDRIFKIGPIKIGEGCSVGAYSEVLYNTVMEPHSSLDSLSLLMKGETLPANSSWQGIPAQYYFIKK